MTEAKKPMLWSELEKLGVKRCGAWLRDRKTKKSGQCRKRALEGKSYCVKHNPVFEAYEQHNRDLIELGKCRRRRR